MTTLRFLVAELICSAYVAAQPTPTFTSLYSFAGGTDAANPVAPLVIGGSVLGGTTYSGGADNAGTVFSLTPPVSPGGAWSESVLHSFGGPGDGSNPNSRLVIGFGGLLYGTTFGGGASNDGTVFSMTPPSSPGRQWTEAVIYSFDDHGTGYNPEGLAISSGGVIFGTTLNGGSAGVGAVFALTPPASAGGVWQFHTLHSFQSGSDGSNPNTGVTIGADGVLYGTTPTGGAATTCCPVTGNGTVYSLAPPAVAGDPWTEAVLYDFSDSADGFTPNSAVVIRDGVLYGTTGHGGGCGCYFGGTIYSLTPPASAGAAWTVGLIYSFLTVHDHYAQGGPVILGENGVLYCTTLYGGSSYDGTVMFFEPPASPGGAWTAGLLHTFTGSDGAAPVGLVRSSGGVLYGVTEFGGTYGDGTVFEIAGSE